MSTITFWVGPWYNVTSPKKSPFFVINIIAKKPRACYLMMPSIPPWPDALWRLLQ